jgi:hypothetical protein
MKALGADKAYVDKAGYIFKDVMSYAEVLKRLKGPVDEDDLPAGKEVVIDPKLKDDDGDGHGDPVWTNR